MKKTSGSRRWLKEHFSDPWVKQSKQEGYRSRAVYKLKEMQERYHLFHPGMIVIDLGAAPGGWSQLIAQCLKSKGRLIALDILPLEAIAGVEIVQGDFTDELLMQQLRQQLAGQPVDWVLSDMAPNMSGNESIDTPRAMALCEMALHFALRVTRKNGGFLVKTFQGSGFEAFLAEVRTHYKSVMICKPRASRGRSREVYILARGFKETLEENI